MKEPRRGPRAAAMIALALLAHAGARAGCQVNSIELPVTMVGGRAVATVGINGTTVPLTVDSGAFYSVLTEAAAQQLELKVRRAPDGLRVYGFAGAIATRMTRVDKLVLTKGEIPNVEFIVGGNEPGAGTMGLMGRNLLAFTDTEYDLAHGMIRFMFPTGDCDGKNMAYWAGDTPISVLELRTNNRERMPAIQATAKLNGEDVRVLFDTGASSVVSLRMAHRAGVTDAAMKPAALMYGGGQGSAKSWVAPIDKFEIGGEVISHNRLSIADFDIDRTDMLVGIDFFLSHRIYVSRKQDKMFFTYNGGRVFALNAAAAEEPAASDATAVADGDAPTDAASYARRGAAYTARRDYVHALADLDHACALAPQVADNFVRRAEIRAALKQFPLALQDLDTALRLDPAQAEARVRRGWMRIEAKDRDGALADLQALDKTLAPQSALRLDMAQMYMRLELPAQALPQWNLWVPAHRKEYRLEEVLNARCWARAMLGIELDKALEDCDDAVDLAPKNAAFIDSRAWVHLRRGELREALSDFDRSIKLRPDGAWSLYGRGLAHARRGEAEASQADLAAARQLVPTIAADVLHAGVGTEPDASTQRR
ncbi:MAG: aspartyl protease family protein [Betaproteobacteria bacterium]